MNLLYPLEGIGKKPGIYLTQKFGEHAAEAPAYGGNGLHNGIDWGAPEGTPIRAAHDGQAKYLNDPKGFGNHVKIYGADGMTVYGHMSRFEGGDRDVKAGEIIGYVGSTGYSTGNHLHFGYRPNGANQNDGFFGYADPQPLLTSNIDTMQNPFAELINLNGTVGVFIKAELESDLEPMAKMYQVSVPKKSNGQVDFDKIQLVAKV